MGLFSSIKKSLTPWKSGGLRATAKIFDPIGGGKSFDFTKGLWDKHTGVTAANMQMENQRRIAEEQQKALDAQIRQAREDARKARVEAKRAATFDQGQKSSGVGDVVLGSDNVEADLDEQLRKLRVS